jgi:maltose-binding protein MalE
MISFLQYITEKFLKGMSGSDGYSDIYLNPTANELTQLGRSRVVSGGPWGDTHLMPFGSKYYYAGGILNKDGLYAFDRDKTVHDEVKYEIPNLGTHWVPLYLHYFAGTNVLALDVSGFSITGPAAHIYNRVADDPAWEMIKRISKHPAFRSYAHIVNFRTGEIAK